VSEEAIGRLLQALHARLAPGAERLTVNVTELAEALGLDPPWVGQQLTAWGFGYRRPRRPGQTRERLRVLGGSALVELCGRRAAPRSASAASPAVPEPGADGASLPAEPSPETLHGLDEPVRPPPAGITPLTGRELVTSCLRCGVPLQAWAYAFGLCSGCLHAQPRPVMRQPGYAWHHRQDESSPLVPSTPSANA
jgi:hypothetical protein